MQLNYHNKIIRPAWVEIDLDAVAKNVSHIKSYLVNTRMLAVVKANAYGLGAVPLAKTIMQNGADMLGVVMLDEAAELRAASIDAPILNMGPIFQDQADMVADLKIEQMAFRPEIIAALSSAAQRAKTTINIHFKIDTGMSRYGARFDTAAAVIREIINLPGIHITSAFSHFPKGDAKDMSFARLQTERLLAVKQELETHDIHIPVWHTCNSGGTLNLLAAHFDMVRVGLMNYGYFPSEDVPRPFRLEPAIKVKTRVAVTRWIKKGDTVGYGRRFLAEQDERIAVLPMGYSDGYPRKLSQVGQVLWNGHRLPIIGGLCMDAFFVKITDYSDIKVGDEFILMGKSGDEEIDPHDIAKLAGTVSYDIISNLGRRLPRVYKSGNTITHVDNQVTKK